MMGRVLRAIKRESKEKLAMVYAFRRSEGRRGLGVVAKLVEPQSPSDYLNPAIDSDPNPAHL